MSNWQFEMDRIDDAIRQAITVGMSAPRVSGKCQASIARRNDGYRRVTCLECGFTCEGFIETENQRDYIVKQWNEHIIYR